MFSHKGYTFAKIHFPSLYSNNSLCIINSVLLSHSGYSKEPIYRPHFMKKHMKLTLAKLFNLSLEEGIVPSEWKEANIARSCLTNLLCFFEEITKCVDDWSPVDVVYLDFRKLSIKCHIKDCYLN